jgi:colicin import membrane protein
MSTIQDPRVESSPSPVPGSEADPFRYGWRYVTVKQSDGRVELEQVPLTLEDLLFPEEGDFAVQYPSHINDCRYLMMVFQTKLAGDPEALVLHDCRVDWNLPGVRPLGPDIAVFLGVPNDFDRGTLGLFKDAAIPVLVVEVTSPDTRKNDFGIKKDYYHRAGVPVYIIVDARPGPKGRRVKLHGFRQSPEGYEPLPLDDQGRLWVEPMGLWLAIADRRVVCIDGETGEPIGDYGEQVQARIEAEARFAEAEARILELEAEIRRLRGEA